MKTKFFILLFLGFFVLKIFSQDSTEIILKNASDNKEKIELLLNFAKLKINTNPDSALSLTNRALILAKNIDDKTYLANVYKVQAIVFYYKGELDSSLNLFYKSADIFKQIDKNEEVYKIYNNIGVLYKTKGELTKALEVYNEVVKYAKKNNKWEQLAGTLTNIANIYTFQGNVNKALDYNFKALKIVDSVGLSDKKSLSLKASIYINIAVIFNNQKNLQQAKKYYLLALKTFKKLHNTQGIADIYLNLGVVFSDMNEADSAVMYYKKALDLYSNPLKKARALFNIGDLYNSLKQTDSAYKYLIMAMDLYKELKNKRGIAQTLSALGQYYYIKGDYSQALNYLKNAYDSALVLGDLTILKNVTQWLSLSYAKNGDYKNAFETHILFKKFNDSLFNAENERKITQLNLQYEFDKKQREQQLKYEAKIQKQKLINSFILVVVLLLIITVIFIYRAFKVKKKSNELLKLKNAEIMQQKEEIEAQRDEIDAQKKQIEKQAEEIKKQRDIAIKQKKNIEDSIHYAVRIQQAVMPNLEFLKKYFQDYFIFFKPRDIVSGDFYWAVKKKDKIILTIADCTGHGVPGAFMSLLGITFLNEIVSELNDFKANIILEKLRTKVIVALKQKSDALKTKDGMDMALIVYDYKNKILQFSGAYNPLYLVRQKNIYLEYEYQNKVVSIENEKMILYEFKADKIPIGLGFKEKQNFKNALIKIKENDILYMFSDGFPTLLDFEKSVKFSTKRFKQTILNISVLPLDKQYDELERIFKEWIGDTKQVDDVIVGGFKV